MAIALADYNSTSHFEVDAGGTDLLVKKANAMQLIQAFGMDSDYATIDFPYLYHHTFVIGNLNFELNVPPSTTPISEMVQAYKAECLKRSTNQMIEQAIRARFRGNGNDDQRTGKLTQKEQESNSIERFTITDSSSKSLEQNRHEEDTYVTVWSGEEDGIEFAMVESRSERRSSSSRLSEWNFDEESKHNSDDYQNVLLFPTSWEAFLDWNLSRQVAPCSNSIAEKNEGTRTTRKLMDLLSKSNFLEDTTDRKWNELFRLDELRMAMESKEIFCGFEEPLIKFLPPFPRLIGSAVEYSALNSSSCTKAFVNEGKSDNGGRSARTTCRSSTSEERVQPAFKDRILSHSLQDTKARLRNRQYWICEKILTSSHKPVCSIYELDIDRLYAYKTKELEFSQALRDRKDVKEYRIQLGNLDANLWTYTGPRDKEHNRRLRSDSLSFVASDRPILLSDRYSWSSASSRAYHDVSTADSASSNHTHHRARTNHPHRPISLTKRVGQVFRHGADIFSHSAKGFLEGNASSRKDNTDNDLFPVEPVQVSTIFPLPSEDPYASQRKVYEVAHAVQVGFQRTRRDKDEEEAELAYMNQQTCSWREASTRGIRHCTIARAVNGVLHIAIKIQAEKDCGGQGVLCIRESQFIQPTCAGKDEFKRVPFDLKLAWGGRHVGYLHGDIVSIF